jgi:hypothetical protein
MKLPVLDNPTAYRGLYLFEFDDSVGVGYTAEEIEALLASERYAEGKVYKIYNAYPDGTMEIRGVPASRFQIESGTFFCSLEPTAAAGDYEQLLRSAAESPPPCRAKVQAGTLEGARFPHAVGLIYPAEAEDEIGRWLLAIGYKGGEAVDAGPSHVSHWYRSAKVHWRAQLQPPDALAPRSREALFASVGRPVQRRLAAGA